MASVTQIPTSLPFPSNTSVSQAQNTSNTTAAEADDESILPVGYSINPAGCPTINDTIYTDNMTYQVQCYRTYTGPTYQALAEPHFKNCIQACDNINGGYDYIHQLLLSFFHSVFAVARDPLVPTPCSESFRVDHRSLVPLLRSFRLSLHELTYHLHRNSGSAVNGGQIGIFCYGVTWLWYAGGATSLRCLLKGKNGLNSSTDNDPLAVSAVLLTGVPAPVEGAW